MPNISNATVASGTGLSTAGNGGAKLTRLQNGALVSAVRSSTTSWRLLKSTDNGATWSQIVTVTETVNDLALASKGNDIHVVVSFSTTGAKHYRYNDSGALQGAAVNVESGQSAMGNVSLAINEDGTEIHGAWTSRNATYQNSFNIRYAKGTINGDGSVTWGAVEQVTKLNSSGADFLTPTITVVNSNVKIIYSITGVRLVTDSLTGGSNAIQVLAKDTGATNAYLDAAWKYANIYNATSAYAQSNPSALFVPQSINGLANGRLWVAWHGRDATDSAKFNIRASYSDDGGVTWATPTKLTSGNTFDRLNVSLSADKTGKVFALYEDHQWAPDLGIRMKTYNGTWGAEVGVATADTAEQHPSALVDYSLQMTTPPFVYTDTTLGIRFTGNFNVGASVSPASGALGNKETQALTAYTVTPEAGSTVTQIVERINGTIVNTFNNPASLSRTLTAPQATWDTLAYFATHSASVTVTDSNGAQTVTTYTFDKTLSNVASLIEATKANNDARTRMRAQLDAIGTRVGVANGSSTNQIITAIDAGNVVKKASGSATLGSDGRLTVTGLSFKPSYIIFNGGNNHGSYNLLSENTFYRGLNTSYTKSVSDINDTGFSFVITAGAFSPVSWTAFGN